MEFGSPAFVVAIVALSMGAWVITTWIRAKHGYPLCDDNGNSVLPAKRDDAQTKALVDENAQLKATVGKLEERLKVLERIATDPAKRLSDDIDSLR